MRQVFLGLSSIIQVFALKCKKASFFGLNDSACKYFFILFGLSRLFCHNMFVKYHLIICVSVNNTILSKLGKPSYLLFIDIHSNCITFIMRAFL